MLIFTYAGCHYFIRILPITPYNKTTFYVAACQDPVDYMRWRLGHLPGAAWKKSEANKRISSAGSRSHRMLEWSARRVLYYMMELACAERSVMAVSSVLFVLALVADFTMPGLVGTPGRTA